MSRCIKVLIGLVLILVFPLQAYAQILTCNGQVGGTSLTPGPYFDGTQQATGDIIRYDAKIGATDIQGGTLMAISEFDYFIDCLESDNYPNCALPGTNTITYLGNVTSDCVTSLGGATLVNWADSFVGPNEVHFLADSPAVVGPQSTCTVSFDIRVDSVGSAKDIAYGNQRPVFQVGGFVADDAACDNGRRGSGSGTAAFSVAECAIDLEKRVSVTGAGGPFLDADSSPGPDLLVGGDAYFQLEVCNTGTAPFVNPPGLAITDGDLGIDTTLPQTLDPNQCAFVAQGEIPSLYQPGYCVSTGAIENESDALGTCRTGSDPISDSASNNAWVNCVAPSIDIIKRVWDPATSTWVDANSPTGPTYPVGAVVSYQLEVCNDGDVDFTDALIKDDDLGIPETSIGPLAIGQCVILEQGQGPVNLDSSIPCEIARQFENIAEVDGIYPGGVAEADDPANVICEPPELRVIKSGPDEAKRTDDITYTVCAFNDSPTVALANCDASDTLPITDTAFPPAPFSLAAGNAGGDVCAGGDPTCFCYSYDYTVPADSPTPLPNTATVECEVVGVSQNPVTADSKIDDSSNFNVPLFEIDGYMVKTCDPDPVSVGEQICWNITVYNTGDKAFDCTITDNVVPDWVTPGVDLPDSVAPGGSQSLAEVCRTVDIGEAGSTISNTATAVCTPSDAAYTNAIDVCADPLADCSADCEVPPEVTPVCRTPGFWGTHAGTEKEGRSFNLAQEVIDYSDKVYGSDDGTFGLGDICGVRITSTDVYQLPGTGPDHAKSSTEAICVHPKTKIVRQLMRQMTAAAINCVMSGTSSNCAGLSIGTKWAEADAACKANSGDLSGYIEDFDAFNNGYYPDSECVSDLNESPLWPEVYDHKVPGPAGSSDACNYAIQNDWYLVPDNGYYPGK